MLFKKTAIIGLGLIGSSLAAALRKYEVTENIIGITRSETYKKALKDGLVDEGYPIDKIKIGVKKADLVVLAVPIRKICALIPELLPVLSKESVLSDVGSTKHVAIEVAKTFERKNRYFIGGHPMAGSEKSGYKNKNHDLFKGRPYAIVPAENTPEEIINKFNSFVTKIGAKPLLMDSITHDRIVAGVSHLPQLLATALINVVGNENENDNRYFKMSGPALLEMTRIAESDFSMWEDILVSNNRNISTIIQSFIEELKNMQKSLAKPLVQNEFESGKDFRRKLLNVER